MKKCGTSIQTSLLKLVGGNALSAILSTAVKASCQEIGLLFVLAIFINSLAAFSATSVETGLANKGIKDLF